MLNDCKWIWIHNDEKPDEYADFIAEFDLKDCTGVSFDISVDGNFEAYLNGKLCAFGACADYPDNKFLDSFSLDEYCQVGKNELKITVWHFGAPSSVYFPSNAGLIFKISQRGNTIVKSDENILTRNNTNYTNGLCKKITGQLGFSYKYDNTFVNTLPYEKSVIVEKTYCINSRGIDNLTLLPRADVKVEDDGKRLVVDLGCETAGYLDLEFESEGEQELLIVYGEHFDDEGRVPRIIGSRDFSIEFVARNGENKFLGMMRRLAGRYIEIEHEKPIKLGYIGLRPVVYPLNIKERQFENELHKRIYDTCVNTLVCCMHEHYEDCPWREQALYSLDSRNQMLCGYIAFDEYRYARYNIILLSRALNDGLLRITAPNASSTWIPFFSLTFIQQVYDYVKFSNDRTILDEVMPAVEAIFKKYTDNMDESGIIPSFASPAWNFYEWSQGNEGRYPPYPYVLKYELCLNAMYLYVLPMYKYLGGSINVDVDKMRAALKNILFDEERGLYKNSTTDGRFSVVGNSLAILAGVGDASVAERLISQRDQITDVTLSMNTYFYDALLSFGDCYKEYIIKDIEEKYGYMLSQGATTFWETIEGWQAFSKAGSLCHGWSALPIYYFDVMDIK